MSRANKELQFYQEKAQLSRQLDKMEEKKRKKMVVEEEEDDDDDEGEEDVEGVAKKKMKNLKKMMDYHKRKRRHFKQREPLQAEDRTLVEPPAKRKKTEA